MNKVLVIGLVVFAFYSLIITVLHFRFRSVVRRAENAARVIEKKRQERRNEIENEEREGERKKDENLEDIASDIADHFRNRKG